MMFDSANPRIPAKSPKVHADRLELKITSDPANLREVRTRVEEFARNAGLAPEASEAVGLVINEALANVIRHGYGGAKDRPIVITAEADEDQIRLGIRDWQKPFDSAVLPKKEPGALKPGGLGLTCIRKLMDDAKYERLPDGMLLTLVKRLKSL